MCPPSCSRSPARYSGPSRTGSRSHSLPRCWRCLPVRLGRDRIASSSSGSTAPVGTLSRTWLFRRGSGWSTCPHTPPSFSPPSTSGPFWMSRSPTSTSRPWPISSTSSPSAVAFSMAISSNPAQTSTGGPSQLPRSDQPETVLEEALARHGRPEIFNTDQGSQFTSSDFTSVLLKAGIAISMDGRGSWRDNVFVERLWRSIKYEEVYLRAYDTVSEARASIGRYFAFYNGRRPHSSLDRQTPDQAYFNRLPQAAAA